MFGINKYVAGALIALVVVLWSFVTYRVINYLHLKRTVAEQAQTISTVKKTQEAVSNLDQRIARGETTIDQELCKKGWMANCTGAPRPAIAQFVTASALADPPSTPVAVGSGGSTPGAPPPADGAQPSPPLPSVAPKVPPRKGKSKAVAYGPCKHTPLK